RLYFFTVIISAIIGCEATEPWVLGPIVLLLDPWHPETLWLKGHILIRLDRAGEAVHVLKRGRSVADRNADVRDLYCYALCRAEHYDVAIVELEQAYHDFSERQEQFAELLSLAYGGRADRLANEQRYEAALGDLENAIEIRPDWPTPYIDRAGI